MFDKSAQSFRPRRDIRLRPSPFIKLGKELLTYPCLQLMGLRSFGVNRRSSSFFWHLAAFCIDIHKRWRIIQSSRAQEEPNMTKVDRIYWTTYLTFAWMVPVLLTAAI